MRNNNLIESLSKDLTPWKTMDTLPVFTLKWFAISFFLFGINYFWMPVRIDMNEITTSAMFHVENILWVLLAFTSSVALYKSAFPDNTDKKFGYISIIFLAALIGLSFTGENLSFTEQWPHEMDLWRGRCGFIISFFAVFETPALALWAQKGAPSKPGMSGAWAALSSASVGCLLMQAICDHHNSAHLLLWHFLPLVLMCAGSYVFAKKLLRW